MKITCAQMDVLISFYIEDELSKALRKEVENHLNTCSACRAKYDIIYSMVHDLKNSLNINKSKEDSMLEPTLLSSPQYRLFKNNLSAYIDNELPSEENIRIKKIAINNKKARKDLEDSYHIRSLIKDSFSKSRSELKTDYRKNIVKSLHNKTEDIYIPTYTKWSIALCSFVLVSSVIALVLM